MITVTIATTDRTLTEFRTDDPARALDVAYGTDSDDYVFIKIEQDMGCDLGRVVLRAWANFLAAQTPK